MVDHQVWPEGSRADIVINTSNAIIVRALYNHTCCYGFVGRFVDEDKAARHAVAAVTIIKQRLRTADADPRNIVHAYFVDALHAVQRIDI